MLWPTVPFRIESSKLMPRPTTETRGTLYLHCMAVVACQWRVSMDILANTHAVPKAIDLKLVEQVKAKLSNTLIEEVYREDQIRELLNENEEEALERERVFDALKHMEKAMIAIQEVKRMS